MRIKRQFIRRQLATVIIEPLAAAGGELLRGFNLRIGRGQIAGPGFQCDLGSRGTAAADVHALPIGTQVACRQILALRSQFSAGG